jgi:hypothetical protein
VDERPTSGVEKPSLEYEQRISFVSRKQYRRLMALTLLNTILLAGFIVGPSVGPMVKSQWQQFQARREQRRAEQRRAAAVAAAKAYVPPAGLVVYEERPDEAAKLLAANPSLYRIINNAQVPYIAPRPWQPPVQLKEQPVSPPDGGHYVAPVAFAGPLRNPSGKTRLVIVTMTADQKMTLSLQPDQQRLYFCGTQRALFAQAFADDGGRFRATSLRLDDPKDTRSRVVWTKGTDWNQGEVSFSPRGLFRIYAGRVDPTDPSHFTIDYELDDQRGTIDGRMREDDQVELRPRGGAIIDRSSDGREAVWDPYASPPATRP